MYMCSADVLTAVLEQCFLAAGAAGTSELLKAQSTLETSFIDCIRHLLVSRDMNEVYLFVTCLGCIDTKLWAGTTPEIPAVLQGWEVERVMQLLDCADHSIRVKVSRQSLYSCWVYRHIDATPP